MLSGEADANVNLMDGGDNTSLEHVEHAHQDKLIESDTQSSTLSSGHKDTTPSRVLQGLVLLMLDNQY